MGEKVDRLEVKLAGVKHVRDSAYWKLPVGTPIVDHPGYSTVRRPHPSGHGVTYVRHDQSGPDLVGAVREHEDPQSPPHFTAVHGDDHVTKHATYGEAIAAVVASHKEKHEPKDGEVRNGMVWSEQEGEWFNLPGTKPGRVWSEQEGEWFNSSKRVRR